MTATRPRATITARLLETLKPEAKAFRIPDARCAGLAIRVAPSGGISFDLAFKVAGSYRRVSLGRWPDIKLEAARDRANDLTRAARAGRDLIGEEAQKTAAAAARLTVAELAEEFIARRVCGRLRSAVELELRIKRTIAPIASRAAADIQRRDLRELLDAVADAGHLREVDQRRVCLNGLFRWAVGQDYIASDPTIGLSSYERNPPRTRVLAPEEIRALWLWFEKCPLSADTADVLRVQLALGARVSEVGGMCGEEFNSETWLWTLPAERSKNKKPRVTPIIGIARDIIAERLAERGQRPLFTTSTGIPINSMHVGISLRDHRPPIADFVSHDLRRTAATQMAEALGIGLETIARILGHVAGGSSVRVLARHYVNSVEFIDQKTNALAAWDARLRSIIAGEVAPSSNVVALAEARRAAI